jgi:hypothetical protein
LEFAKDRCGANEQCDEANDGCDCTPLGACRGENAGDQCTAGWPHEAFELGRELIGHLLSIKHQPNHTPDKQ